MNWSSRRIRQLAEINNAQSYLEIGVNEGHTFHEVNLPYKDAVDPNFLFDVNPYQTEKVRFFREPSDLFWASQNPKIYDVIFIDGLHTFEQTFRDMVCSMRFSHERTIWLIDDTLPSDVFSAMPNQQQSYRERQRMNIPGWPWHGDVFKLVIAIHDFLPVLNYATIINSGNPQTLAWYAPRANFKPCANNLETISRLTFFDIEPNIRFFKCLNEEDAMIRVREDFTEELPHWAPMPILKNL